MRSAIVDNRSRSMWLLAGLGVLIWAAFSVFLSSASAHAEETPAHPAHQSQTQPQYAQTQSQKQTHPQKQGQPQKQTHPQKQPRPQRAQAPAAQVQQAVSTPPRAVSALPKAGPAAQAASPQRLGAGKSPAAARRSVAAQTTSELRQRPEARSLPSQAKNAIAQITRQIHHNRHPRGEDRAHDHADRAPRAHAVHAIHLPVRAGDAATRVAPLKHPSHEKAAPVHVAPVAAAAPVAQVAASVEAPARSHSPFDSRGTSTQHQPAAPPSAASASAGPSSSPGVVPGAAHPSDVLGPLLAATHADDAVLPTGPASTTDSSPD